MASNTSSISITKIAAATIPEGVSASSEQGRKFAERVVGKQSLTFHFVEVSSFFRRLTLFQSRACHGMHHILFYVLAEGADKGCTETRGVDRCLANLAINTGKSKSLCYRLWKG